MARTRTAFLRTALTVSALAAAFSLSNASAQCISCLANINLPATPVAANVQMNNSVDTTLASSGLGGFAITLSGSSGDVPNGLYTGWCGDWPTVSTDSYSGKLYSTYGALPLAGAPPLVAATWNEVNYILNNKTLGGALSDVYISDVQSAIWLVLTGHTKGAPTSNASALEAAALANPAFVPGAGQVVAIDVYYDGFNAGSVDAPALQDLIIEVPTPDCGVIGDYVWNDTNNNGIQDTGETGINGVTVNLYNSGSHLVASMVTGPYSSLQGQYVFKGLCAGTYSVQVDATSAPLASLVASPVNQGTDNTANSKPNPDSVTLATDRSSDRTADFGYTGPCTGAIGDFIWNDLSKDGIQDSGEPGIGGVKVNLLNGGGQTVNSYTTNATGYYQFTNVCAGTYTVQVDSTTVPAGFLPSTAFATPNTAIDSNGQNSQASVSLNTDASTDETIDFGYYSLCNSEIGDLVWNDTNRNGIQDETGQGLNGVGLSLSDSLGNILATTTTAMVNGVNGTYLFGGLCQGTYTVTVTSPPPGMVASPPNSTPDTGSVNSPATVIIPDSATNDLSVDFGYNTPCSGSIGDFIWNDLNGNGIQDDGSASGISGLTVNLLASDRSVLRTTTTSASGGYTFSGLCAGAYYVSVVPPAGYSPTTTNAPGSTTANDSNGNPAPVTLSTYSSQDNTIDIGFVAAPSLTCAATNSGEVNAPFSSPAALVTGGLKPFTFSLASGTLPAGLTLDPSTGAITGTPTAAGAFTLMLTDANGVVATQACPFTIFAVPALICSGTNSGEVGLPFDSGAAMVTGGAPPFTFSIATGKLPPGLSLNASTGEVTGTPQAAGGFTLKLTDALGASTGTCAFTITVAPPLLPLTVTCPGGTAQAGVAYSSSVVASGGAPNYTYSVAAGALPTGLTLNASTGAITGTPTAAGAFGFTIKATDSAGASALSSCSGACSVGVTNTWSFISPVGKLGNSQAYAVGGLTITAYGYTTTGTAAPLYGQLVSGNEFGLGVYGASQNEIDTTHFVQLDLSAVIAAGATNAQMVVNSVQCRESYAIYGSNTLGTLGTLLNGNLTGDNDAFAIPSYPTYRYVSIVAKSGTVLLASVSFNVGACKIVVAAAIDLQCGSCGSGNIVIGVPYSSQLAVVNGTSPYTFSLMSGSSLPPGLSLNTSTGAITGIPTTAGSYTFTSKVVDKNGNTDTQTCTLVVVAPPIDLQCGSCGSTGKATVGTSYSVAYAVVNGKSPYKFTLVSGTLPPGLSLNAATGAITGTPTTAGTYKFTTTVVDANGNTDTQQCAITVVAPPLDIECGACGASGNATVGTPYSTAFAITGGTGTLTYSIISGSLPPGLSLNGSTGKITGSPTSSGTYTFTVKAVDSAGSSDTTTCTIKVTGSTLALACGSCGQSGNATVGTTYSATLTASGGAGSYTYSIASGSLPPGLTLNASTGVISGKPTTAGTYTFTSQVKDRNGNTDTASCTIKVAGTPVNLYCGTCGSNNGGGGNGTVGVAYSSSLSVSGGTAPYAYSIVSGSLPPGLTLNASTGAVSGTPTTAGTYTFTSKVVDKNGNSDTTSCTFKIVGATIDLECGACGQNGNATTGTAYSETVSVSGGSAPYTYSIASGSLPPGLTLNASTGAISGSPTAAGVYTFTTKVVDKNGNANTATCTIKVTTPPLVLQPGTCGSTKGRSGHGYSGTLQTSGGSGNYSYSVSNGSLPDGLKLDNKTGAISGTPTHPGTWVFTPKVTDSNGNWSATNCIVVVCD